MTLAFHFAGGGREQMFSVWSSLVTTRGEATFNERCKCTQKNLKFRGFDQVFIIYTRLLTYVYAPTNQMHPPLICSNFVTGYNCDHN